MILRKYSITLIVPILATNATAVTITSASYASDTAAQMAYALAVTAEVL